MEFECIPKNTLNLVQLDYVKMQAKNKWDDKQNKQQTK